MSCKPPLLLELNRSVASLIFGPGRAQAATPDPDEVRCEEMKAMGLSPVILASAGYALFGGQRPHRKAAGLLALTLFLAI